MKYLIISQCDFKSGKGHINRSNLVYKYLKKKKITVDYFSFSGSKKELILIILKIKEL